MRISNRFPNFRNEDALVIVAGEHVAKMYRLKNGNFSEKDAIKVETPLYTDKESFFESINQGQIMGSGSMSEPKDFYLRDNFFKEIYRCLKEATYTYKTVFLSAPQHLLQAIKEHLPKDVLGKLRMEVPGNYIKHHPFTLLEKMEKALSPETGGGLPLKVEAAKLLSRGRTIDSFAGKRKVS